MASTAAVVAVVGFAKSAIDKYQQVGTETIKLSRLTGGTAEDMSALRVQAQMAGVPFDTLTKSVTIMAKGLRDGKPAEALSELGIAAETADGKSRGFQLILGDLAEKFQNMPNSMDKTKLATDLFGRAGADMEPLLNKGRDGLENIRAKAADLGLVLDGPALEAMKRHIQAQRDAALAMDATKVKLGEALMPVMTTAMGGIAAVAEAFAKMPEPLQKIALYGSGAAGAIALVSRVGSGVGSLAPGVASGAQALLTHARDAETGLLKISRLVGPMGVIAAAAGIWFLSRALKDAGIDADALRRRIETLANVTTLDNLRKALREAAGDGVGAFIRLRSGAGDLRVEIGGVETTLSSLNRVMMAQIKNEPAAAIKAIDLAIQDLKKTGQGDTAVGKEALASLDELRGKAIKAKGSADDLTASEKAKAKAMDGSAESTDNAKSALEEYANVLKAQTDPIFAVMNGSQQLKDAQVKVWEATLAVTDAHQKFKDGSPEVVTANQNLTKAQQDAVLAAQGFDGAMISLQAKIRNDPALLDGAKAGLQRWVDMGLITAGQAEAMRVKFDEAAGAARSIPTNVQTVVRAVTSGFTGPNGVIGQIQAALRGSLVTSFTPYGFRASGGPVTAGGAYVVGERGPEMFVPTRSGRIIPTTASTPALAGVGVGRTVNYTVEINAPQINAQAVGAQVIEAITAFERSNGTGWRAN